MCFLGCFSLVTWKYLLMWYVTACDIFLSTCKLCTISLFRWYLSNSILFWWISVIYFNCCATLLWLFMWHILKTIWKYMHWNLNVSINSKVLFLPYKYFLEKIKYLHMTIYMNIYNSYAQLFGTSITLLQLMISLYYLFFIHPEASIGVF